MQVMSPEDVSSVLMGAIIALILLFVIVVMRDIYIQIICVFNSVQQHSHTTMKELVYLDASMGHISCQIK